MHTEHIKFCTTENGMRKNSGGKRAIKLKNSKHKYVRNEDKCIRDTQFN